MASAHPAHPRRTRAPRTPHPRPLDRHARRYALLLLGLHAWHLRPRRKRAAAEKRRQHHPARRPAHPAPRRSAGRRRQRQGAGGVAADRPDGRQPVSGVGTPARRAAEIRIQVPDRRPQDPDPDHVGGRSQPPMERPARRRRTHRRSRGVPPLPRTQVARSRNGDSGLFAPLGSRIRRRRILRPETADRLGRRNGPAGSCCRSTTPR